MATPTNAPSAPAAAMRTFMAADSSPVATGTPVEMVVVRASVPVGGVAVTLALVAVVMLGAKVWLGKPQALMMLLMSVFFRVSLFYFIFLFDLSSFFAYSQGMLGWNGFKCFRGAGV